MRRRFSVVLGLRADLEQIIATTCSPISPRWAPVMAVTRSFSGSAAPQRQRGAKGEVGRPYAHHHEGKLWRENKQSGTKQRTGLLSQGETAVIPFLMPLPGVQLQRAKKSKHKHSDTSRITLSCERKPNKVCSL